jgi:hypothetical protein
MIKQNKIVSAGVIFLSASLSNAAIAPIHVTAGQAGSAFFPFERAFDNQPATAPTLSGAAIPGYISGGQDVYAYSNRWGYVDFGTNYANVRIYETWTGYRPSSGSHSTSPFPQCFWSPNITTNTVGTTPETQINFLTAASVTSSSSILWYRDWQSANAQTAITPPERYLILNSATPMSGRATEFLFVGEVLPEPTGVLGHFVLTHNGTQLTNEWGAVEVRVFDTAGHLFKDFTNTVNLTTDGAPTNTYWRLSAGAGSPDLSVPGEGIYTFATNDMGVAFFDFSSTAAGALNLTASNTTQRSPSVQRNTAFIEGPLQITNSPPAPTGLLGCFVIRHTRYQIQDQWKPVEVRVMDSAGFPLTNYTGTVRMTTDGPSADITWRLLTGEGSLDVSVSGECLYTFAAQDAGVAVFEMASAAAARLNLTASGGAHKDDDSEGVLDVLPENHAEMIITVTFDQAPSAWSVEKCSLKYGKDFAYSWSMDDAYDCSYTAAWHLFNGGTPFWETNVYAHSDGLYYTDGCGNAVAFTAGLAWNSVSSRSNDLHTGSTPGYMTWTHLIELYTNGWDCINHSWSHAATWPFDRDVQILNNITHVSNMTAGLIVMNNWIRPGGTDSGRYYDEPFDPESYGIKAAYDQDYPGKWNTYKAAIDPPHSNYNLPRRGIFSTTNTVLTHYREQADLVAAASTNGVHWWLSEYTHRVGKPDHYGGSMRFADFREYMEYLAAAYGKNGSDRIWFAGPQTVNEYLKNRDACAIETHQVANVLTIRIDRSRAPGFLSRYALSLTVDTDQPIAAITVSGEARYSENRVSGLINLEWIPAPVEADTDKDGLPDWWEIRYFASATAANPDDPAANGVDTVKQCYIAGIDPTDPNSFFLLTDLRTLTSGNELRWPSVSGRVYTVYWTTNLLSGFQPVGSNITGGAFTDAIHPGQKHGFYKIGAALEK